MQSKFISSRIKKGEDQGKERCHAKSMMCNCHTFLFFSGNEEDKRTCFAWSVDVGKRNKAAITLLVWHELNCELCRVP